jgi:hypothetical protein
MIMMMIIIITTTTAAISCHSVTVQTKELRKYIHKRNNTKYIVQTIKSTVSTSTHITKTNTHYKTRTCTHPHITKTNTHIHTRTHYKTS